MAGHIGKCAQWLLYSADEAGAVSECGRIQLPKSMLFHHYKDQVPHPLSVCRAVIGASAGDSFVAKMRQRGFDVALTAEVDPATAVAEYLRHNLAPPKPRPIGSLVCKLKDQLHR